MKTLISTSEKYRRNNERRREARGYQARRLDRIEQVIKLRRLGWSTRAIGTELGCSQKTVSNELRPLSTRALRPWTDLVKLHRAVEGSSQFNFKLPL